MLIDKSVPPLQAAYALGGLAHGGTAINIGFLTYIYKRITCIQK